MLNLPDLRASLNSAIDNLVDRMMAMVPQALPEWATETSSETQHNSHNEKRVGTLAEPLTASHNETTNTNGAEASDSVLPPQITPALTASQPESRCDSAHLPEEPANDFEYDPDPDIWDLQKPESANADERAVRSDPTPDPLDQDSGLPASLSKRVIRVLASHPNGVTVSNLGKTIGVGLAPLIDTLHELIASKQVERLVQADDQLPLYVMTPRDAN